METYKSVILAVVEGLFILGATLSIVMVALTEFEPEATRTLIVMLVFAGLGVAITRVVRRLIVKRTPVEKPE